MFRIADGAAKAMESQVPEVLACPEVRAAPVARGPVPHGRRDSARASPDIEAGDIRSDRSAVRRQQAEGGAEGGTASARHGPDRRDVGLAPKDPGFLRQRLVSLQERRS